MTHFSIDATRSTDIPALQGVLAETELFPGTMLPGMLAGFLGDDPQDIWLTCHHAGAPVGLCYARPEPLTDRTWNMLALAVLPTLQGQGLGAGLVAGLEAELRRRGQRLLIVETSGSASFAATRRFYANAGYAEDARIRDFWAEGDAKVVFRKPL